MLENNPKYIYIFLQFTYVISLYILSNSSCYFKKYFLWEVLSHFQSSAPSSADTQLRAQAVFSDVHDDFCDVKKILSRFEEWRRSYSESYYNAYISLCLPKLLNPIITHQLLGWNPLKVKVPMRMLTNPHKGFFNLFYFIFNVSCKCLCLRMSVETLKTSRGSRQWRRSVTGTATRSSSTPTGRRSLMSSKNPSSPK